METQVSGLAFTSEVPTEEGAYWWTNFGEHTPTVLRVKKSQDKLYAFNDEFHFEVDESEFEVYCGVDVAGDDIVEIRPALWARIPNPILPDGTEASYNSFT